ncbi:MAG: YfhO family protein [Anaerolineae bacterium]|nr:YfhO family protein [Anaerolineae bacterium]
MIEKMYPTEPYPRVRPGWADALAIIVLVLLTVAFFWRMVFTDLILPRGDVFAYFYPYWDYRNAVLQTGRLPLWNPYLFMGTPFLANSQAGVLYPLNWLLVWLDAPNAIKVAIVFHMAWAAIGMYLFGRRSLSLSILGATLGASILAFGGYLTAQVEHVNQLQGLAWLPWLFWLWDELITRKHLNALFWLGLALAMQLLAGHTQSAFISGIGLGAWTLWHAVTLSSASEGKTRRFSRPRIGAWPMGALALAGLLALGLAAAQLLPTIELTRLSNRGGGLPFDEAVSFSLRPWIVGRALLPSYSTPSLFSEYIGYVGIAALLLALTGAWARRRDRATSGLIMLAALGVFLAVGAYNPVYWALVKVVPGFNLFRVPARWMILWAFGAAGLAGVGLDIVMGRLDACTRPLCFTHVWRLGLIVIGLAALAFAAPLAADHVPGATRPGLMEIVLWAITLGAVCASIGWVLKRGPKALQYGPATLATIAVLELFLAARSLPYNHLSDPAAWSSQRPAISTLLEAGQNQMPPARFLSLSDTRFDPGDLREIEAVYGRHLPDDALYDFIVTAKQKEILAPNLPLAWGIPAMDGFDGGVLPTRDYTRFTALFLDQNKVSPDGRLRENLSMVPDLHWLSLANVGWIITDKVYDVWLDNAYYDLQFPACRTGGTDTPPPPIEAYPGQPFVANAVGIVGHLEGVDGLAGDTQVGSILLFPEGAKSNQDAMIVPLLVDSSQPEGIGALNSQPPTAVGSFTPDEPNRIEYHTLVELGSVLRIDHIEISVVSSFSGTLAVRGATLIDQRSGAFVSTTLSENHTLHLANSGDVKIYEYRGTLPRAYLTCHIDSVSGEEAMWEKMQQSSAGSLTVIDDPASPQAGSCDAQNPGQATITTYEPERVTINVQSAGADAYLVLSDAWYPGWEATIDGAPTDILRANGLFRAVRVPEGEHQIVFTYRSRMLIIGAVVSGVFLVVVIGGLVACSRSYAKRENESKYDLD